jgi:hypothetical protein
MLSPEFICVPDLNPYFTKHTGVGGSENKIVIYPFTSLAVCYLYAWQFSRVNDLPLSLSAK